MLYFYGEVINMLPGKPSKPESKSLLPVIHYVWVGPPSPEKDKKTMYGLEKVGHDVAGPMAMLDANNKNPITFWCLKDHKSAFEKKFQGKNVNIYAIEDYVQEKKQDPTKTKEM